MSDNYFVTVFDITDISTHNGTWFTQETFL